MPSIYLYLYALVEKPCDASVGIFDSNLLLLWMICWTDDVQIDWRELECWPNYSPRIWL